VRALPVRNWRRVALAGAATAAPVLIVLAAVALRVERFRSLLEREGTAFLRLHLWRAAVEMIADHALWGIGLDQFLYHYPRYMRPEAWREPNLSHPHQALLDFWLRLGILGAVALVWAGATFVRRCRPAFSVPSPQSSVLVLGAAGMGVAWLAHGLLDNSYFVIDLAYATWIMLLLSELATERTGPTQLDAGPASEGQR
jgi:O-antigen ligase